MKIFLAIMLAVTLCFSQSRETLAAEDNEITINNIRRTFGDDDAQIIIPIRFEQLHDGLIYRTYHGIMYATFDTQLWTYYVLILCPQHSSEGCQTLVLDALNRVR